MSLPFHLAWALLKDPVARRRYLRVGLLQTVAALVLALTCMGSGKEAAKSASREDVEAQAKALRGASKRLAKEQLQQAKRRAREKAEQTPGAGAASAGSAGGSVSGNTAALGQDDAGTSVPGAIVALALEAARSADELASIADNGTTPDEGAHRDTRGAVHAGASDGGTALAAPSSPPPPAPKPRVRVKMDVEDSPWTVNGFSLWSLAFWATLFGTLHMAQWVVIALSRDYHDVIARDASLLTGVPPEDEEKQPHVRLDTQWLRKKFKRRWRAALLFAVGVPALAVLTLPFLCVSRTLFTVLTSAWGAWWLVVFTAAKSEHAWVPAAEPRAPWFVRAWTWLTTRVPGLRWPVLQRYGAYWARRTEEVLAPVNTVERHPWAFAGLAVVRFVGSFPPLKCFVRPLIPVASAHLLAEEAAARAAAVPPAPRPQVPAGETGA